VKDGGATLALLGRAVLSLLLITGLILVAYMVIRRYRTKAGRMPAKVTRQGGAGRGAAGRGAAGRNGRRVTRQQLVVLSRISTSRTSAITAVQFGDRVLLVGSNDQSTTNVLAEMPLREWEVIDSHDIPSLQGLQQGSGASTTSGASVVPAVSPAEGRTPVGQFLEALRTATARHA
jgi:flagellar biogenesis protein FliO